MRTTESITSLRIPLFQRDEAILSFDEIALLHFIPLAMTLGLLLSSVVSFAQGTVTVNADKNFEILLDHYKKQNEAKASIPGYRIHIMSSPNRTEINNLKAKLYTSFPDIKPYMSYHAPNFKLRAGNYFYKLDAYRDLQKLMPQFPGCFIVNEELKTNEL
jgi:hypothetical protein